MAARPSEPTVRHQWTQSDTYVYLTFYAKGMSRHDCQVESQKIEFTKNTSSLDATNSNDAVDEPSGAIGLTEPPKTSTLVAVSLKLKHGEVFHYTIEKLFGCYEVSKTTIDVTPMKVEIRLAKVQKGVQWMSLEAPQDGSSISPAPQPTPPNAHPTTTTAGQNANRTACLAPRNWDKACEEELQGDEAEGEAVLTSMFRDIYERGDDNTRRAMIKSFQTSGGTVLSTNWEEVNQQNYEESISPPHGQEVRKW